MSCNENYAILEAACERAEEEGLDTYILSQMDLDDVYEYLMTGKLHESYNKIIYLESKV